MFVYTIDDIIVVSIFALILCIGVLFGIAVLIARVYNWLSDKFGQL